MIPQIEMSLKDYQEICSINTSKIFNQIDWDFVNDLSENDFSEWQKEVYKKYEESSLFVIRNYTSQLKTMDLGKNYQAIKPFREVFDQCFHIIVKHPVYIQKLQELQDFLTERALEKQRKIKFQDVEYTAKKKFFIDHEESEFFLIDHENDKKILQKINGQTICLSFDEFLKTIEEYRSLLSDFSNNIDDLEESAIELFNTESFGDKIKRIESKSAKKSLEEDLPIIVRLDGKAFHTFTRNMQRPFDERLSKIMIKTMNFLLDQTNAKLGYTQSDEITLVYFKTKDYQETMFNARIQKLTSTLASMATAKFNQEISQYIPEKKDDLAFFDCRVWNVPDMKSVVDVLVWRQEDAIKNAISMAAHSAFGHKKTLNKNSKEKILMMKEKNIDFDQYPDFFKSGTFSKNILKCFPISDHLQKFHPDETEYWRHEIENMSLPLIRKMENPEEVLFKHVYVNHEEKVKNRNKKKKNI